MQLPYDSGHVRRRFYLVRHGHAMGGDEKSARYSTDVTLTSDGIAQAQATRDFLREVPFDDAWSSHIGRAEETARIILEGRNLALKTSSALQEVTFDLREAFGKDGNLTSQLRDFTYDMWRAGDADARVFGVGESYSGYCTRAAQTIQDLCLASSSATTTLLVTHGGFMRAVMCWATGAPIHAFGTFDQDHCSVSIVDADVDLQSRTVIRRHVRLMNFTPLDPDKRRHQLIDMEVMSEQLGSILRKTRGA